jgi:hypothetical protein
MLIQVEFQGLLDVEENRHIYKSGIMGVSTEVYRARIGAFNGAQWKKARNTEMRISERNISVGFGIDDSDIVNSWRYGAKSWTVE